MAVYTDYHQKILYRLSEIPPNAVVCIYGCGQGGIRLKRALETSRKDIRLECFLDTYKQGIVDGLEVIQVLHLLEREISIDLILVASVFTNEILYILEQAGITNYKIPAQHLLREDSFKLGKLDFTDPYPGKPKLLFIALAHSSHTHSWINLLKGEELNVRVFGVKNTQAPSAFSFPTYTFSDFFPGCAYNRVLEKDWLSSIIREWRPDIIHTLGFEAAAYFYLEVMRSYRLEGIGKWVVTARGGPELTLKRLVPDAAHQVKDVLEHCDQLIADNPRNYDYAIQLGLDAHKVSPMGMVPGVGGVDVKTLSKLSKGLPSQRERLILYPKAYECPASKSLPVFEAFRLCWDKIKPCKIFLSAMNPETIMWFYELPEEIKSSCILNRRIARKELLEIMGTARVVLAPSLSDGVPNVLYEAMATGAFPILSPLESITEVVSTENALFVDNLYPAKIAEGVTEALTDDHLVDAAAQKNLELIEKIADRRVIREKVKRNYMDILSGKNSRSLIRK